MPSRRLYNVTHSRQTHRTNRHIGRTGTSDELPCRIHCHPQSMPPTLASGTGVTEPDYMISTNFLDTIANPG